MESNLKKITERIRTLARQLAPQTTGEDAEMEIIRAVADEPLSEMGEIEHCDDVRKSLVNMFPCGRMFP